MRQRFSVVQVVPGVPLSYNLSIFSAIIGLTAWVGSNICEVKPGETVVVSGAAGAVGSAAAQIMKNRGATVIGIAGSDDKCKWLTELGLAGVINYKTEDVPAKLKELCPNGVNAYFDNVGGAITEAVMHQCNNFARVAFCGFISGDVPFFLTTPGAGVSRMRPRCGHMSGVWGGQCTHPPPFSTTRLAVSDSGDLYAQRHFQQHCTTFALPQSPCTAVPHTHYPTSCALPPFPHSLSNGTLPQHSRVLSAQPESPRTARSLRTTPSPTKFLASHSRDPRRPSSALKRLSLFLYLGAQHGRMEGSLAEEVGRANSGVRSGAVQSILQTQPECRALPKPCAALLGLSELGTEEVSGLA